MLILKIAFRNIFRQRRRSFYTAMTMIGGYVLFSIALSMVEGTYGTVIEKFTNSYTGHLQVHMNGYFNKPSIYKALENYTYFKDTLAQSAQSKDIKSITPRIYSAALASKDKKTSMAKIIGIDPVQESKTTSIRNKIAVGSYFSTTVNPQVNEVMIGSGLAEVLNLKLGESIVLVGQGADGSISNDLFKVVAILKGDNYSVDKYFCYMNLTTAQNFLALDGRFHEIVITLNDYKKNEAIGKQIEKIIANNPMGQKIEVLPWQKIEKQFYNTMIFEKKGMRICLFIIVLIVGISVLNTVLMIILERTTEYGVLKALGTRPETIFKLIVLETALLALISIAIGAILSLIFNYTLSIYGINYPQPIEIGGFILKTMFAEVYPGAFINPALVTFFTAVIVSIIPAFRAMKIKPIEAMRSV